MECFAGRLAANEDPILRGEGQNSWIWERRIGLPFHMCQRHCGSLWHKNLSSVKDFNVFRKRRKCNTAPNMEGWANSKYGLGQGVSYSDDLSPTDTQI